MWQKLREYGMNKKRNICFKEEELASLQISLLEFGGLYFVW